VDVDVDVDVCLKLERKPLEGRLIAHSLLWGRAQRPTCLDGVLWGCSKWSAEMRRNVQKCGVRVNGSHQESGDLRIKLFSVSLKPTGEDVACCVYDLGAEGVQNSRNVPNLGVLAVKGVGEMICRKASNVRWATRQKQLCESHGSTPKTEEQVIA